MQANLENGRAHRHEYHSRSAPTQLRPKLQRAVEEINREDSAQAVANKDDFLCFAASCGGDKFASHPIEPWIEDGVGGFDIGPRKTPIIEKDGEMEASPRPLHQSRQCCGGGKSTKGRRSADAPD